MKLRSQKLQEFAGAGNNMNGVEQNNLQMIDVYRMVRSHFHGSRSGIQISVKHDGPKLPRK